MSKIILHGAEARTKIQAGVDTLANAVKVTLGPKGRNVVIQREFLGAPLVTKDGVTVARQVFLEDPIEDMGAQMVKEVASKTVDEAGDGTTTATVLAQAIFTEGLRHIAAKANPMELWRGIELATAIAVGSLKKSSLTTNERDLEDIATISANGDREIGKLVSAALEAVGIEGVISLETSRDVLTHLEIVEGMEFDRGYVHPFFVNRPERNTCVFEDCAIYVTEHKIANMATIKTFCERMMVSGNPPILFIVDDMEGEAIQFINANMQAGHLKICVVKAPSYGNNRREMLRDIAMLTGARAFVEGETKQLTSADPNDVGHADSVTITARNTTISGPHTKDPEAFAAYVEGLRLKLTESDDDLTREQLKQRIARLVSGVASIKVGGATETEVKEKQARVEDAIHAVRAAAQEGIQPGGGMALVNARKDVESYRQTIEGFSNDTRLGMQIVSEAMLEPFRCIVENAGKAPQVELRNVEHEKFGMGYNAAQDRVEDLYKAGIIDPTKVVRLALQNAASIAGLMLTTEAVIAEKPLAKK